MPRATALLALLLALALAGSASAKPFLKGTAEEAFTANDPSVRAFWHDQGVAAGSNIARINVYWRGLVSREPADASDPADPAYVLGDIDRGVIDAVSRGQRVVLTVYGTPDFAVGPDESSEAPKGTWKPSPKELGDFAEAIATRYSGTFSAPGLGTLPRVGYLEVWNEPNLSEYLTPQYTRKSTFAGDFYREMVNAFSAGVRRSSNPGAQIVAGAAAPYGDPVGGRRTRPLRFFRDFLCLDSDLKPRERCRKGKADFDILSHHPITLSGGPGRSAIHPDDVAMPDVKHLVKALRSAERKDTVGGGPHPVWVTEFWWESNPPDPRQGVPVQRHAKWIQESLYSLWKQGVDAAIWFLLGDEPLGSDGFANQQSGLFFEDRSKKPAFTAFRFPFVGERMSKKKIILWTIPPATGALQVEQKVGGSFRSIGDVRVTEGEAKKIKVNASPEKIQLRGVLGGDTSLAYTVK